jgi:N-terminal region of glycosyl transferase group 7/N-terminal domain of galactosyltransferase
LTDHRPRLCIVVPYRDRPEQLRQFVQHTGAYFSRDKTDSQIPYSVLIVEQSPGLPFNRGALKNIGFLLGEGASDYTCFHDVDYLPMWADYTWSDAPAPLVWYGAEIKPVAPGRSTRAVNHVMETFFGAAVLFPNATFRRIDGYSNEYWGWGFEDEDIRSRLIAAQIATDRRRGTFLPLHHDNEGYRVEGGPSAIHTVNRALFEAQWTAPPSARHASLATVAYQVLGRRRLPMPVHERQVPWEIVTVRLDMTPRPEQLAASRE